MAKKSLEINPSFTKSLYWKAKAHENLKEYLEACKDLKRLLKIEPES